MKLGVPVLFPGHRLLFIQEKQIQITDCWHLSSQAKDKWILELPILVICFCRSQIDTSHLADGSDKVLAA